MHNIIAKESRIRNAGIKFLANPPYPDRYDYSKFVYKGNNQLGKVICRLHGEFEKTPSALRVTVNSCPTCILNTTYPMCDNGKRVKKEGDVTIPILIARFKIVHGDTYDYSLITSTNYHGKHSVVPVVCKTHGLFNINVASHYRGAECQKCAKTKTMTKLFEQWLTQVKKKWGNRFDYSETLFDANSGFNITVTCTKHNLKFITTRNLHLNQGGCPECILASKNPSHNNKLSLKDENMNSNPMVKTSKVHARNIGKTINTKHGLAVCIDYLGNSLIKVRFPDATEITCSNNDFRKGLVTNPNFPTVFGVGTLGIGSYSSKDKKLYRMWHSLMEAKVKHGALVDDSWLNFQNFCRDVSELDNFDKNSNCNLISINPFANPTWSKHNCKLEVSLRKIPNSVIFSEDDTIVLKPIEMLSIKDKQIIRNGLVNKRKLVNNPSVKPVTGLIKKSDLDQTPCGSSILDMINEHFVKVKIVGFKSSWLVITTKQLSISDLGKMRGDGYLQGGSVFPIQNELAEDLTGLISYELGINGFPLEVTQTSFNHEQSQQYLDVYFIKVELV